MVKTRTFADKNYHAVFHDNKTMRIALDNKKPILDLDFPEFYDVKVTNYCRGNCPYCYQNSTCKEAHTEDLVEKFEEFFGGMTENEKPFQIAFGGGEPTEHPDFCELIKKCSEMGICPNYTTNGMNLTEDILKVTKECCGGVAVSTHRHLNWGYATRTLIENDIKTNLHIIISDKKSVDDFVKVFKVYPDIHYFVLLPHVGQGRAKDKKIEFEYLAEQVSRLGTDKIAFGAKFYPYLKDGAGKKFDVSLYEPEILSKYLDMTNMKVYKSSFSVN